MTNDYDRIEEKVVASVAEKDREAVSKWLLEKRATGLALNSVRTYGVIVKVLSELSPTPLAECTREEALRLLIDVQERFKSTVLYKHVLRDVLRVHGRENILSGLPLNRRRKKREWQDPANVLARRDIQRMLATTRDVRDKAMVAVLWDSGARCHEIAAIQIGDLRRVKKGKGKPIFSVWFREQKTAGEERRIPLYESSPSILAWLRAHPDPENPEAPLFTSRRKGHKPAPLGTAGIRNIVELAKRKAKIEKPCHPHSFRHGRATDLKMRGVSDDAIRTFMGWVRDSDMPMRYVSRREEDQIAEVADKLGYEPLPPPGPVEDLLPEDLTPEEIPLVTNVGFDVEKVKEEMMEEIIKRLQVHGSTSFDGMHVIVDKKDGPRKSQ